MHNGNFEINQTLSRPLIIVSALGPVNRFLLLSTIIAALLCACQRPPQDAPEPPPDLPPVVSARYFLYDRACHAEPAAASTEPRQIYLTDFAQPLDLDAAQQSLRTPLIGDAVYGQTFQRRCHFYSKRGGYCLDRDFRPVKWTKVDKSGGKLRICDTEQDYPRESFEHVALVTALHLQKAQRFFVNSTGLKVPRMSLLVMPFFRTIYTDKEDELRQHLMYRNIIYYPASKSLAVLPDSDNFHGRGLWESSFIIAHEFAHHAQFAEHPKWSTTLAAAGGLSGAEYHPRLPSNAPKRSIEAFLEGWADLYAFYAESENPSDIISYPCFGYNRDIANPVFADRSPKMITPSIVARFYAGTSTSSSCVRPDFSDAHTIGAVLAHHLHRIVSFVLLGWGEAHSPAHKYHYMHNWLSTVFAQVQDRGSDQDLLRTIIAAIFQTIEHELAQRMPEAAGRERMTAQVCALFETGFPSLSGCKELTKI